MRSLAMQVRYLRTVASAMDDGEERLRARIALAFAALALPVSPPTARAARRNLEYELKRQILPDGGHISRNPVTILNCWPIFCRCVRPMPMARNPRQRH